jgi:hypothetical protein
MEVSGQLHAPADLLPGKNTFEQEVLRAPEEVWMVLNNRKYLVPVWIRIPDHPARSISLYYYAITASN